MAASEARAEVFGDGLSDVGKRRAQAEVDAPLHTGSGDQQRDVFARVIRSGHAGVAPVVRGEDREVAGAKRGFEPGKPGVELLERASVALDVVAMAVLLVKIDQVDEDLSARDRAH